MKQNNIDVRCTFCRQHAARCVPVLPRIRVVEEDEQFRLQACRIFFVVGNFLFRLTSSSDGDRVEFSCLDEQCRLQACRIFFVVGTFLFRLTSSSDGDRVEFSCLDEQCRLQACRIFFVVGTFLFRLTSSSDGDRVEFSCFSCHNPSAASSFA